MNHDNTCCQQYLFAIRTPMDKKQRKALDLAIDNLGGIVKAAERFGVTVSAIGYWRAKGVPFGRLKEVSEASGVSREQLRPDLYA